MKTTCEKCDTKIDKRGLTSHQQGHACRTQRNAKRARERGLKRCGQYWQIIKSSGVQVEYVEDRIKERGFAGRRTKTGRSLWAPTWAITIAQCDRPVHECREFLAWALEDAVLRPAIVALANAGGRS